MSFTGSAITLVGLAKIELPSNPLRLCDGGFCYFDDGGGSEKYTSKDDEFGTIESVEPLTDSVGGSAPEGRLIFLPASGTSAATLSSPSYQNSRMRFWLGELNSDGKTVDNAELLFDGLLDQPILQRSRGKRRLEMSFISRAEKLFLIREGNTLSTRFHQSVWSGELGFDNATGLGNGVAWGVESPGGSGVGSGNGNRYSTMADRFNVVLV